MNTDNIEMQMENYGENEIPDYTPPKHCSCKSTLPLQVTPEAFVIEVAKNAAAAGVSTVMVALETSKEGE
jgi:hypothetical protein